MLQINDTTYSVSGESITLGQSILMSSTLTPMNAMLDTIEWTPQYGIDGMKAFGASDKGIYKIFGRWLKPKYFIKRIRKSKGAVIKNP